MLLVPLLTVALAFNFETFETFETCETLPL